jgi:hypothetical protein
MYGRVCSGYYVEKVHLKKYESQALVKAAW